VQGFLEPPRQTVGRFSGNFVGGVSGNYANSEIVAAIKGDLQKPQHQPCTPAMPPMPIHDPKFLCCDISTIRFEIQRAIHPPLTPPDSVALGHLACEDRAHIRLDPPTPHFSRPEAKEQAVVSTGGDVEPEQAGNVSKKDHEASPPAMKGKAVPTVPPTTRKDRRAYTHMTPVPRFLRCLRKSWVMKRMSN
jgi:hypothetical protein